MKPHISLLLIISLVSYSCSKQMDDIGYIRFENTSNNTFEHFIVRIPGTDRNGNYQLFEWDLGYLQPGATSRYIGIKGLENLNKKPNLLLNATVDGNPVEYIPYCGIGTREKLTGKYTAPVYHSGNYLIMDYLE